MRDSFDIELRAEESFADYQVTEKIVNESPYKMFMEGYKRGAREMKEFFEERGIGGDEIT